MSDPHARASAAGGARKLKVAVAGMSVGQTCGVRDHAVLLADALAAEGVSCSLSWLWREDDSLRGTRSQIDAWLTRLSGELEAQRPDALLLHYSVFSFSHRGVPVFVPATFTALRRTRIPLIAVMHEFVFPWTHGGLRGKVWAVTQRTALIEVMRASRAVVLTTDERAGWLHSRPWLPRRTAAVAPVFSNLPEPTRGPEPGRDGSLLGLFGYSDETTMALVLDVLGGLRERGADVRLRLLGAPGERSPAAEAWRAAAASRQMQSLISFSGVLPAQALADELGACDVLLFADRAGPTSRKGTLAGSLASGRPVVATDGPQRWAELVSAEAALVVDPSARAMVDAVLDLLADTQRAAQLGARGRAFAERTIGVSYSARVVRGLLDDVLSARA